MIKTGVEARHVIRSGQWLKQTSGLAPGYTQANLVILPYKYAFDFLLFCMRNPKPCPVLEVLDKGSFSFKYLAKDGDVRTDIPKYRIYENGILKDEVNEIKQYFNSDMVSFLIGCSFTFERALIENNIPVRHIEENKNVPMYITNIQCKPAGIFNGPMVVSMRPIPKDLVQKASDITAKYRRVHGSPIHIGNPQDIGIKDINSPEFGQAVSINPDEVPVFWACGVTPQAVVMNAKPDFVITHSPGHMFIADILDKEIEFSE